jgi:hypothetical protein
MCSSDDCRRFGCLIERQAIERERQARQGYIRSNPLTEADVRRIVREHGGEIDLVSHEGEGLECIIRLPQRDQRARLLPPAQD